MADQVPCKLEGRSTATPTEHEQITLNSKATSPYNEPTTLLPSLLLHTVHRVSFMLTTPILSIHIFPL